MTKWEVIKAGRVIPNEKGIKMPPKNAISIGASNITLYGEMDIDLVPHTYIKDENGKVVARIDHNKYRTMLTDNTLDEKTAKEATIKYMKENGLKSIDEIIEESKIKREAKKAVSKKSSGHDRD